MIGCKTFGQKIEDSNLIHLTLSGFLDQSFHENCFGAADKMYPAPEYFYLGYEIDITFNEISGIHLSYQSEGHKFTIQVLMTVVCDAINKFGEWHLMMANLITSAASFRMLTRNI